MDWWAEKSIDKIVKGKWYGGSTQQKKQRKPQWKKKLWSGGENKVQYTNRRTEKERALEVGNYKAGSQGTMGARGLLDMQG